MAQIETDLSKAVRNFEQLQMSDRDTERTMRRLVGRVLKQVRSNMSDAARRRIVHNRADAWKAVKHMVYKRVLGGNVNILDKRRGAVQRMAPPPEKDKRGRRGNHWPRSQRTTDLLSYYGEDRAFILRFLNAGTDERQSRYGNRGHIAARNFFASAGNEEMKAAAQQLAELIEKEIEKISNKK